MAFNPNLGVQKAATASGKTAKKARGIVKIETWKRVHRSAGLIEQA